MQPEDCLPAAGCPQRRAAAHSSLVHPQACSVVAGEGQRFSRPAKDQKPSAAVSPPPRAARRHRTAGPPCAVATARSALRCRRSRTGLEQSMVKLFFTALAWRRRDARQRPGSTGSYAGVRAVGGPTLGAAFFLRSTDIVRAQKELRGTASAAAQQKAGQDTRTSARRRVFQRPHLTTSSRTTTSTSRLTRSPDAGLRGGPQRKAFSDTALYAHTTAAFTR